MRSITTVTLFILLMFAGTANGQQESSTVDFTPEAREFFQHVLKTLPGVPGFSIAVVKGDQTILLDGFGRADLQKDEASTATTNYYIASSTKSFTALLAAILDQRGIIGLNDPLSKYFPDTEFAEGIDPDRIRIRDLLDHTSGLSNEGIGFRAAYSGEHDLKTMTDLMRFSQPNKSGYGNHQYTNVGYNIYSIIVDNVTGKKWQDWLRDEILDPAGLKQTSAYMSDATKHRWQVAKPYAGISADNIEAVYLMKADNTMQAAGGLITTAADLARWIKLQLHDGQLDGKQVVSSSIIRQVRKASAKVSGREFPYNGVSYGMGWEIGSHEGQEIVYHFGGFPGYLTHVSFMPEKGMGVAVLINDAVAGYFLMQLLANYAYDSMMGVEGTEGKYRERLAELAQRVEKQSKAIEAGRAKRAKRTWQLSKPFTAYSGKFYNEEMGTIEITGAPDKIKVEMGNMHCIATPYLKDETIRVELSPFSGEVIQFVWEEEKLVAVRNGDMTFSKIR